MERLLSFLLSLVFVFGISCVSFAQKEKIQNPTLAKEIVKMRDQDQKLRNKWVKMIQNGKNSGNKFEEITDLLISTDLGNTARMREIVATHGWPTRSMVGGRASSSAWLLVQHADRDPLFQIKCLPLLKEAVDNDEASPRNYAYLYDRVAAAKGEMQLYATQSSSNNGLVEGTFYPIEDEANVQIRRTSMGIDQHVEAYAKSMGFEYKVPTPEEAIKRNEQLINDCNTNRSEAISAEVENNLEAALNHYKKVTAAYGIAQADDFYNYARLLCIQKPEESGYAPYSLIKAALKGYDNPESWEDDPIFTESKKTSPRNWKMLINTINLLKNK